MNLQSVVIVLLRLAAVNFAARAVIVQFAPMLAQIVNEFTGRGSPGPFVGPSSIWSGLIGYAAVSLSASLAMVTVALVFWFCARPIARLAVRDVSSEISLGGLTLADGYAIAFVSVGISYIASGFPLAIAWIQSLASPDFITRGAMSRGALINGSPASAGLQLIVAFGVGITLLVNARNWGIALAKKDGSNLADGADR